MECFKVIGGNKLNGKINVSGAKNAILPVMAASILTENECKISNVPTLSDVRNMVKMVEFSGALTELDIDNEFLKITANNLTNGEVPYELSSKLRASFLFAGPLLARMGKVKICMPGGCAIGSRPIDLHLKGLDALGAKIRKGWGFIEASAPRGLKGGEIYLDFPSVGATENLLMAACLAKGETIIKNAAAEPEIMELARFLKKMGAKIYGDGTDTVIIEGVKSLSGCDFTMMPDRIEAGTFMTAVAVAGGDVEICNVIPSHLDPVTAKLRESGVEIKELKNSIRVISAGKIRALDIKTLPYPGFPTDMQAQMTALMTQAGGTSIITETIFENRFLHIGELTRMGAHIKVQGRTAIVEGKTRLTGATVHATDLRAGAALIVASLVAEGETIIKEIEHIERGYTNLENKLTNIGVNIVRTQISADFQ